MAQSKTRFPSCAMRRNGTILSCAPNWTPGVPSVSGDRVQLQQVILNLAMNGIESIAGLDQEPRRLDDSIRAFRIPVSFSYPLKIPGSGIEANMPIGSLLLFSLPNRRGSEWDYPSAGRSWRRTAAGSGPQRTSPRGAAFHFILPATAE